MESKNTKLDNKNKELNIHLLAKSRMLSSLDKAYRLIKLYSENSNKFISLVIPATALANKSELKKLLLDAGYNPDVTKEDMELIFEELAKPVDKFITLRYKPGFYNHVYLCTNEKVIGEIEGDKPVLHPKAKNHLPVETKQGTSKEWKINVAIIALNSTRIMLAILTAFSGFLLKLLDMEGGGFHLWGTSSMGKSSSTYVLASVAGEPNSIITLWNNTDKGLEEIAVAHNDSTLILDESKLLDKDPIMVAKIITNRVYTLAGGKGKARSALYENNVAEWSLAVFSTGELSLAQHAKAGKIERLEGENVRMIDVPADAGHGMGIFESLPEGVTSSNELAHLIKDVTHRYYGSAKPLFLKRLIEDIQADPEGFKRKLEKGIEFFLNKHGVDRNSGIDVRIAKRFALAYVSGCLAIKYGILPFNKSDAMNGISKCYCDSLNMPCSPEPTVSMVLPKAIADILKSDDIVNLIDSDDLSDDDILNAPVVLCNVKGQKVFGVDKTLVHANMTVKSRNALLPKLTQKGVLLADSQKDYSTVQIRYQGKPIGRRYCFVCSNISDLLNS